MDRALAGQWGYSAVHACPVVVVRSKLNSAVTVVGGAIDPREYQATIPWSGSWLRGKVGGDADYTEYTNISHCSDADALLLQSIDRPFYQSTLLDSSTWRSRRQASLQFTVSLCLFLSDVQPRFGRESSLWHLIPAIPTIRLEKCLNNKHPIVVTSNGQYQPHGFILQKPQLTPRFFPRLFLSSFSQCLRARNISQSPR
jgi:hypothetical protein